MRRRATAQNDLPNSPEMPLDEFEEAVGLLRKIKIDDTRLHVKIATVDVYLDFDSKSQAELAFQELHNLHDKTVGILRLERSTNSIRVRIIPYSTQRGEQA